MNTTNTQPSPTTAAAADATELLTKLKKIFGLEPGAGAEAVITEAGHCVQIASAVANSAGHRAIVRHLLCQSSPSIKSDAAEQILTRRAMLAKS
jgi:hypothetical protein